MKRAVLAPLLLTAHAGAFTVYEQHDFGQITSSHYQPLLLWCDGPDRVIAVGQPSKPPLTLQDTVPVTRAFFLKSRPNDITLSRYLLSYRGAGLGHQYFGFRPQGQKDSPDYYLQMSNILRAGAQYTFDEAYFQQGRRLDECRYIMPKRDDLSEGTVFAGGSSKRSVFVQKLPNAKFEYRSFDYAGSTPIRNHTGTGMIGEFNTSPRGLVLRSGTRTAHADGSLTYHFQNGPYVYRVEVGPPSHPSAHVGVTKNGQTILNEPFRYYSDSRPKEQP